jgi:hypothetical protein
MSECGKITSETYGNGVGETDAYDVSTGLPLKIDTAGLADPLPAGCPRVDPLVVRAVSYSYDQFLNVASQQKQFPARGAGNAIQFNGCAPQSMSATETFSSG